MNKQIIERARAELMAERVAIDNALTSLARVQDGTTAVEATERYQGRVLGFSDIGPAVPLPATATNKRMVKTLRKLKRSGELKVTKLKRGPYKKKAKEGAPADFGKKFEAAGKPAPVVTRQFQINPAQMGGRRTGMRDLIKVIAQDWNRRFNREEMQAELRNRNPKLVEKQLKNTSAQLLGLMECGFLKREGTGSNAVYWVAGTPGKSQSLLTSSPTRVETSAGKPSAKEVAYQQLRGEITVPRDADAETDR